MSATGGFWPGETPRATEREDVQEPEEDEAVAEAEPLAGEEDEADEPATAPVAEPEPEPEAEPVAQPEPELEAEPEVDEAVDEDEELGREEPDDSLLEPAGHVPGDLDIPDGVAVLEGSPSGTDRTVGVVVSRFNGEISNRLLESALDALAAAGVSEERITVMPVPGAFELPIGAMALAKTRRYSCVVALGCVVRGETPHFDYVAGEAASGLQLAGLETGVPVAFGVLTVDAAEQAEARLDRGADAARAALEMADLFSQLRTQAKSG
jgi:6,7-dimethyl-8-ribityllumazine synthase